MSNSSTSTASNNEMSSAGSRAQSSTPGLHKFSLDLLIQYIENVLSAITNQGLDSTKKHSGTELKDLVQPLASDFSKLLQGISDGAKLFSDQSNFLKSRLSTEAHSVAVDVLKGLGNVHWVAVGLLAIANVLERFDNISANDRECIDLLKDMLKLVKYLKLMRDLKVIFHKEVLDDMREAVQLVLSGAILCHSFIKSNKVSKFLLTKKIRDELVYLRGKVNSMKADLQGHVQLLIMKTLIFITGQNDETDCLEMTEQYQATDGECEMEQSCETEIDGSEAGNVSSEVQDICNEKDRHKKLEMTLRSFFQPGKFLRKIIPTRLGRKSEFSLNLELQMLLKEIQPSQIEFNRKELNEATQWFSQEIGEGGFGYVYHGTLSDGRPVAVKMWKSRSDMNPQTAWMNELRISTKLQHRNIMQLIGYCSEEQFMLVSDYMPRNLDSVIFEEDEQIIDWPTRHNIILDITRGLTYLHSGANRNMSVGCIVHRDIKPSNILLDVDCNAKISDFGVARILQPSNVQHLLEISEHEDNAQHANKETSIDGDSFDMINLTCVCGTLGYLDPEYLMTHCLNPKSDIYSFGVLLLNIVSGKRAIHLTEDEPHLLSEEAAMLHKEDRLTELIDPRLINPDGLINSSTILRTIKIALCCIEEESQRRPSASEVLKMLSSEEEISIPTSPDYYSSKEETPICNSSGKYSITESSIADDISSSSPAGDSFLEDKILSATIPLDLSGTDYKFSQEENWTPNFPPMLPSADYNVLEEENRVPTPPIKSFVADDHYSEEKISSHEHSSEEDISIASSLLKSVVVSANSSVQKIGESDTKWSGTSRKTLTVTGVFSFVCFIWLLRMLTNVSPL